MGVGGVMSDEIKYHNKKRLVLAGFVLLFVLTSLGSFAHFRPRIVMAPDQPGIYVKNRGRLDAVIHKVDAFWYWAGQVAFLSDMPPIRQQVAAEEGPVRLRVPNLPAPLEKTEPRGPWYMKLAVRYRVPGIPVFRYTSRLYFEFEPKHQEWISIKSIPPKYRALGRIGMGDVEKIELGLD
jgi:hypothetical protein